MYLEGGKLESKDIEIEKVKLKYEKLKLQNMRLEDRVAKTEKILLKTLNLIDIIDREMGPVYMKYLSEEQIKKFDEERKKLELNEVMYK